MRYRGLTVSLRMLLAFASGAFPQVPFSRDDIVTSDIAVPDMRAMVKIEVPETSAAVEVRLKIEDPRQLDLDLFVYDSDPGGSGYIPPACVSDSIGADEICAVKRPDSGQLWALIAAVNGEGKSPYTLTRSLIDSSRADLVLAQPISPNGRGIPVGPEETSFQFKLETGEVAAVILEGGERDISVEDEAGQVFRVRRTGIGRQQATIGEKFQTQGRKGPQEVDWLLRGFKESKRYLVKVGPSGNPYGQVNTILSVVVPIQQADYVIAFSVDNLDNEPKTIEGPSRNLTRSGKGTPILFEFLPDRSPLMIAEVLPSEIYDIAICDEFGFVVSISTEAVLWDPRRDDASRARGVRGNMYFAIFPSPFADIADSGPLPKFTLEIKPPKE